MIIGHLNLNLIRKKFFDFKELVLNESDSQEKEEIEEIILSKQIFDINRWDNHFLFCLGWTRPVTYFATLISRKITYHWKSIAMQWTLFVKQKQQHILFLGSTICHHHLTYVPFKFNGTNESYLRPSQTSVM